ncbi:HlyD family efflux transporter periplasmic adaptor subunit [Cuneatibacter sp. NSJ-177]|uniref:HlyD family efflux transporter periplasmic adaptor subunit n=1 Tax=Cuneatibacter sp. NSJ-177 TaxID=2931401 RepID=UPI001FD27D5D|nr:HlyD family efflux transporter periplasmic adaptor subunit [Cuneatibacter sp. NSJ-177]MCJ7835359.1 HlyD family efflux transporter periplasmic adaptor subunit [Cuneatibacter sp. NSJ-177]
MGIPGRKKTDGTVQKQACPAGKRKRKRKAAAVTAGLAVLVAAGIYILGRTDSKPAMASSALTMSANVETGSISTTIEGSGSLSNLESTDIKIPAGLKVDQVLVSEGDQVKAGDILATLNENSVKAQLYAAKEAIEDVEDDLEDADDDTAEYYELLQEKEELEEKYERLSQLSETNTIPADSDGIITGVHVSDGSSLSASSAAGVGTASAGGAGLTLLTSMGGNAQGAVFLTASLEGQPESGASQEGEGKDPSVPQDGGESSEESPAAVQVLTELEPIPIASPVTGAVPETLLAETETYRAEIVWAPAQEQFQADIAYSAVVRLTAKEGYAFDPAIVPVVENAVVSGCIVTGEGQGNQLTFTATFPKTEAAPVGEVPQNGESQSDLQNQESSVSAGSVLTAGNGSSGTSVTAGSGVTTSGGTAQSSESTDQVAAFSIASQDQMKVSVNVDELDILSVAEGQKVSLTLDAIPEETFEGEITGIGTTGTSSGGVTKYQVEITLPKSESMMAGMNASASIILEEKNDILLIPSAAVQEQGGRTFVYTEKDEETGALGGEVEVETGLSDGANTEITSGLSNGDTVYYSSISSGGSSEEFSFGGIDMGGMQMDIPGGGGREGGAPSGDFSGGPMGGGTP